MLALLLDGASAAAPDDEEARSKLRVVLLVIVFALVFLGSGFELLKSKIEESTGALMEPILESMFGELTLMGFIGVLVFAISSLGFSEVVSTHIFGEDGADELDSLLEDVHMVLFGIMVIFLVEVMLLVRVAIWQFDQWHRAETAFYNADEVVANYAQQLAHESLGSLRRQPPEVRDSSLHDRVEFIALRLRFADIDENGLAAAQERRARALHTAFDFSEYLAFKHGEIFADMVHVSSKTWLVVGAFFTVLWTADYVEASPPFLMLVVVASGFALALGVYVVHNKLARVVTELVSPTLFDIAHHICDEELARSGRCPGRSSGTIPPSSSSSSLAARTAILPRGQQDQRRARPMREPLLLEGAGQRTLPAGAEAAAPSPPSSPTPGRERSHTRAGVTVIPRTVEEAASLVRGGSHGILIHMPLADPPFRARPLRRRQGWVGRMMGRPANKHEQLFWLDWHGPALMLFFVRACMMLSAVYVVAVVAVAFMRKEWLAEHRVGGSALFAASLVPLVLIGRMTPSTLADLTVASSVEMMRCVHTVIRVSRRQRTRRTLQSLKLVTAMHHRMRIRKLGEGSSAEHRRGAARRVYPNPDERRRREAELRELFDAFDKDGHGTISTQEMRGMLTALHAVQNEEEAAAVIEELDYDGSHEISFEEFFDFLAEQEEDASDPAHVVDEVFDMLDTDGSNTLEYEEITKALRVLVPTLNQEDIASMVREADVDDNGIIDKTEFKQLVMRYME